MKNVEVKAKDKRRKESNSWRDRILDIKEWLKERDQAGNLSFNHISGLTGLLSGLSRSLAALDVTVNKCGELRFL